MHLCHLRALFVFLVTVLTVGCSTTHQTPPSSPLTAPASFKQAPRQTDTRDPSNAPFAAAGSGWWELYKDPDLNALVVRANQGNTAMQAAAARLAYAKAAARQSGAVRLPSASVSAGVSRQQGPLLNAAGEEGTLLTVGASVSYEADVWGRLAQSSDAATLDAESRQWLLQSAQLLAQAQVVQTYGSLRALDGDIALLEQILQADKDGRKIQLFLYSSGAISELEWERARSETDAIALELSSLKRSRDEQENYLGTLLGESASGFHLQPAGWTGTVPSVPAGLPAAMLARRPDVAAAQRSVLAAQKRLGVAQNAWLPNLTLTGAAGYASPDLRDLFTVSMQTLVVGALASIPVLDGGRREAGLAMADAELQSALVQYKEQALNALREVEDQLAATRHLQQQGDITALALLNSQRREAMTASRYRSGLISRMEWLSSQKQELQARRKAQQIRALQYQTSVALVRAIGGGWD
jgi:multidrug efflux system outer membrane protein